MAVTSASKDTNKAFRLMPATTWSTASQWIKWIMERYQVTKRKESGIVILGIETMKIVKALPKLGL